MVIGIKLWKDLLRVSSRCELVYPFLLMYMCVIVYISVLSCMYVGVCVAVW